MISFFEMFDLAKEFYDGVKTGFQHNYWILKNNIQRMSSKRRRNFIRGRRGDSDVNDDFERVDDNQGLQVVGVGFGRTGTYSLGLALNMLNYPTLHTYQLYENSDILEMWTEQVFLPAIQSNQFSMGEPDFDLIAKHGFVGAVDFPVALYFEELNRKYPNCKFILTERENPDVWFESWSNMVVSVTQTTNIGAGILTHVNQLSLYFRWLLSYVDRDQSLLSIPPGQPLPYPDKSRSISSYKEHNERVREVIPSDRLLVYDVRQGWEPLCNFLDVDECPDIPFPKTNSALFCKIQTVSSVLIPVIIIFFVLYKILSFGYERVTGQKVRPLIWRRLTGIPMFMSKTILRQKIK